MTLDHTWSPHGSTYNNIHSGDPGCRGNRRQFDEMWHSDICCAPGIRLLCDNKLTRPVHFFAALSAQLYFHTILWCSNNSSQFVLVYQLIHEYWCHSQVYLPSPISPSYHVHVKCTKLCIGLHISIQATANNENQIALFNSQAPYELISTRYIWHTWKVWQPKKLPTGTDVSKITFLHQ